MFLTVHATASIAISQHLASPILAFVVNFLLHFVLDAIPHEDNKLCNKLKNKYGAIKFAGVAFLVDAIIMVPMIIYLFYWKEFSHPEIIISGIFGSIAPDFLWGTYYLTHIKFLKWSDDLNKWAHSLISNKLIFPWDLIIQFLFLILFVLLIK